MSKLAAVLFSFAVIASGCSESTTGGDGGSSGSGGTAGTGGLGGTAPPPPPAVDESCRDWCANEPEGPSCHEGPFESVQPCYEQCLRDYQNAEADYKCGNDRIAIKDCQVDLECEDLFGDCDVKEDDFDECVRLANNRAFCEASCPEFDITQCAQDTTECREFAEANRYCETRCPTQDRTECVEQYVSTGSCGGMGGAGGTGGTPSECTNQADLGILCAAEFPAAAQACGTGNLGAGADVIGACIAEDTGLSDECAVCFGATTQCTIDNCLADCAPDPLGDPCTVCRAENCDPTFDVCAGEFSCDGVGGV